MESQTNRKNYNFLINASNQANLAGAEGISPTQLNSIFMSISPYYIEKLELEGLDLNISVDEQGSIWINDNQFEAVEIMPGVSLFGIIKR
ncbi:MAG: hypothetical protein CVU88_06940 [Firmicutes bacterium HGW-Firmicutes-13]|nr:MAG: hypothetical protein CVU88_06940 [Firmicutes bacterium HGW-Firmicutes-13]